MECATRGRRLVWGLVLGLAVGLAGCSAGEGSAGGTNGGSEEDDGGGESGEARTLESCRFGELDVEQTSSDAMDDHFSDLPHEWVAAEFYPSQDLAHLTFGLSEAPRFRDENPVTTVYATFGFHLDGQSGQFEFVEEEGGGAYAELVGGEYLGKGAGLWVASASEGNLGGVSGSWEVDAAEVGETLEGTVELEFASRCAPSVGSGTYAFEFETPLRDSAEADVDECGTDRHFEIDESPGQLEVEAGGEAMSFEEPPGVMYVASEDTLHIAGETEQGGGIEATIAEPTLGDNQTSDVSVVVDECLFEPASPADATFTIEENESGTIEQGPTQGSFELQLQRSDESSDSCERESIEVTGSFGVAACRTR